MDDGMCLGLKFADVLQKRPKYCGDVENPVANQRVDSDVWAVTLGGFKAYLTNMGPTLDDRGLIGEMFVQ